MTKRLLILISACSPTTPLVTHDTESALILSAVVHTRQVETAAPLLVTLSVQNVESQPQPFHFQGNEPEQLGLQATLSLTDEHGQQFSIANDYPGASRPCRMMLGASMLAAGQTVRSDRAMSLIYRTRDERHMYSYQRLAPGSYTGHFELKSGGVTLQSNMITVNILPATKQTTAIQEALDIAHSSFLDGRDSPKRLRQFRAGTLPSSGVRAHEKLSVLQSIEQGYPESEHAEWIRFWSLYYVGPIEEAVIYARQRKDFPLSDNLLLRVAQTYLNARKYEHCREIVDEILDTYPDSDTQIAAADMKAMLDRKFERLSD